MSDNANINANNPSGNAAVPAPAPSRPPPAPASAPAVPAPIPSASTAAVPPPPQKTAAAAAAATTTTNQPYSDNPEPVPRDEDDEADQGEVVLDETTLKIMDIRMRLRQRRRKMIRTFTCIFLVVVIAMVFGLVFSGGKEAKENVEEQKEIEQAIEDGKIVEGGASTGITDLLPPPPDDIGVTCALENLEDFVGIAHCENACEVSDCCEVPVGYALSCLAGNEEVCNDYAQYCDILHSLPSAGFVPETVEQTIPPAELKVQIDAACIGMDRANLENSPCMDLCERGFCCFQDQSLGCSVANCQVYFNCADAFAVFEQAGPTRPPTFQDEVEAKCMDYDTDLPPDSPGNADCEEICIPSICCFNHYCTPPAGVNCEDYSPCFVIHEHENLGAQYDEDLADNVHEACFLSNIVEAASNDECQYLCNAAECCFTTGDCDENIINCANYVECNVLHPKFVVLTKPEVDQACQQSASDTSLCEQICHLQVLQCCFHREDNVDACKNDPLKHPGTVFCNIYESCQNLGSVSSSAPLLSSHRNELTDACSDPTKRSQCIQLCSAATCCFAVDVQNQCQAVGISVDCSDYQACQILYGT